MAHTSSCSTSGNHTTFHDITQVVRGHLVPVDCTSLYRTVDCNLERKPSSPNLIEHPQKSAPQRPSIGWIKKGFETSFLGAGSRPTSMQALCSAIQRITNIGKFGVALCSWHSPYPSDTPAYAHLDICTAALCNGRERIDHAGERVFNIVGNAVDEFGASVVYCTQGYRIHEHFTSR